ncbi:DNA-binding FadR family transcriptional regulator [Chitinivorax tropicus]|uniref:DNA-binding FadR family transcriptional regulator n=1 Tax=Chitinivorax tropicus TaxID=714531 RepID=A0A840MMV0_9PROT|nr:GntR family transcriptional regulator [Chitinivorax tropicus]MBB5017523.1 DNA-binding FadR family transcriptional regulator [Chitinivorax tropicus]
MAHPRTLPDHIADYLIAKIFIGELRPGDRLPPERLFADQLGVDRTSLRMALRQLARMNLIRSVQGSGITITDYCEHSGIDFLACVVSIEQLDLGGRFLLDALEQWVFFMPQTIMLAANRPETRAQSPLIAALLDRQRAALEPTPNIADIVHIEIELQNTLNRQLGSVMMRLISNSTLLLRQRIVQLFFEHNDPAKHIGFHQWILEQALSGEIRGYRLMDHYRHYLKDATQPLREYLCSLPPEPRLLRSPL